MMHVPKIPPPLRDGSCSPWVPGAGLPHGPSGRWAGAWSHVCNTCFPFRAVCFSEGVSPEERIFCEFSECVSVCHCSVLDLNAFERQNKAEGLGMVTEEGSGIDYLS